MQGREYYNDAFLIGTLTSNGETLGVDPSRDKGLFINPSGAGLAVLKDENGNTILTTNLAQSQIVPLTSNIVTEIAATLVSGDIKIYKLF